jgi:hypothetical protein
VRRLLVAAALIAGVFVRLAVLSIGVPVVDDSWRAWSYHAATRGPWNLYGPRGHTVKFGDIDAPVVYPPLALDELAIVGRVHMAINGGRFEDGVPLTRTIKGAIALLDALLSTLIFVVVRRGGGSGRAWSAAMTYWANPAVLMTTTLGYIDVFLAIPAVSAVAAASAGRPWLAGALFTAAVVTKPQGLFVGPVVALALWNAGPAEGGTTRVRDAVLASAFWARRSRCCVPSRCSPGTTCCRRWPSISGGLSATSSWRRRRAPAGFERQSQRGRESSSIPTRWREDSRTPESWRCCC